MGQEKINYHEKDDKGMSYILKDYQGKELSITKEQAAKIAAVAELIEVEVAGRIEYINPKNVASISPQSGTDKVDRARLLERPDYREAYTPAKEALRKKWSKQYGPPEDELDTSNK